MLLDVVLTLGILALVVLLAVPPAPRASVGPVELRAEAAQIAATFRKARAEAVRLQSQTDVVYDEAAGDIRYGGRACTRYVPGSASTGRPPASVRSCPGGRALRFLADGRSCGAVMTLSAAGKSMRLRVDWLTGRVEISDP